MLRRMTTKTTGTREPWPLDAVLDFLRLLWGIEHVLERGSKRMAADLGVTGPQRLVLRIVNKFPDISAGELAHVVQLHPSTLTGVLRRLEHKQLIERHADARDHRRALLRVRPGAKRLLATSAGTVEARVTQVLRALPAARVKHAREVLAAVKQGLDDDLALPTTPARRQRRSR